LGIAFVFQPDGAIGANSEIQRVGGKSDDDRLATTAFTCIDA